MIPAHKNTKNPPGQIVNPIKPTHVPTLRDSIQEFMDTEEMFVPHGPRPCINTGQLSAGDCVDCKERMNDPGTKRN